MNAARHVPVLAREVVDALQPRDGGRYLDGTFGAGGYATAMLDRARCQVIALDRDPDAIAAGQALAERYAPRLRLIEGRFGDMAELLAAEGVEDVDGVALDLGVSSMQFDQADRGFSFRASGPLDMRMERSGSSAADLVNEADEAELADIIWRYGEERKSRRVARAIVEARKHKRIETTGELADIVRRAVGPKGRDESDPATRTFQALRIAVNDELGELERGLAAAEQVLAPGGRLAVVSFHSLEDRAVKEFIRARAGRTPGPSRHAPPRAEDRAATLGDLTRKPVLPSAAEIAENSAAVATAVGLFTVKYKVQDLEEKIDRTNQKIIESQQATHILRIEWAHLNEAERIERLAIKHLNLESASIKQVIRLDSLKSDSVPPRRDPPLPSPPRTGNDVPSSSLPGGGRVAAEAGSPSPASAPHPARSSGPTTPPRPAPIQEPATTGPDGDGQSAAVSIDEILSRNEGGRR